MRLQASERRLSRSFSGLLFPAGREKDAGAAPNHFLIRVPTIDPAYPRF